MAEKPKCAIEGCENLCMSRGGGKYHKYCTKHHKQKYGMPYTSSKNKRTGIRTLDYLNFPNGKCSLCGWEGPCDRHRLQMGKDGGKYIKGNIISLCPNCHRLLHKGGIRLK